MSTLIILHEQSEDGQAMPNLTRPVDVVRVAVGNLVRIGHETIACSEDKDLREDLPPALQRVEEASTVFLCEAAKIFCADPYSAVARRRLIDGCRGQLAVHSRACTCHYRL